MKRVVILGRGGAGKLALAQKLSNALDLPVIELDSFFWLPGPRPTAEGGWAQTIAPPGEYHVQHQDLQNL
jgi:adenylate kinase family enzyme